MSERFGPTVAQNHLASMTWTSLPAREQLKRGVLDTDTPEVQAPSLQPLTRELRMGRRAGSLVLFDQAGNPIWSAALSSQQGEAH
jgi:hypothetical protein